MTPGQAGDNPDQSRLPEEHIIYFLSFLFFSLRKFYFPVNNQGTDNKGGRVGSKDKAYNKGECKIGNDRTAEEEKTEEGEDYRGTGKDCPGKTLIDACIHQINKGNPF